MAKDIIHQNVKNALIKDGWTITQDPFPLRLIVCDRQQEVITQWIPD